MGDVAGTRRIVPMKHFLIGEPNVALQVNGRLSNLSLCTEKSSEDRDNGVGPERGYEASGAGDSRSAEAVPPREQCG